MTREKSGFVIIITIVLIIIILIAAFALWIVCLDKREKIFGTAFLRLPNGSTISNEPNEETKNGAIRILKELGFKIDYEGKYIVTFYSNKDLFEEVFDTKVKTEEYSPFGEDFLREIKNTLNAPENGSIKTTFAYIEAIPNPGQIGQEVLLHFGITDSTEIGWTGITIHITKPDGTTETLGSFSTDSTGGTVIFYTPDMLGTYYLQTHFPEQINSEGATMLASSSDILELEVRTDPVSIPTDPPITEFSSPYEDFLQEVENTPNVNLEDFIYVYHQFEEPITIPDNLEPYLEEVKFSPPVYFSHSADPPDIHNLYYYLDLPNELSLINQYQLRDKLNVKEIYNAPNGQQIILNGTGIRVAILDSGFYKHPYFTNNDLEVEVISKSESILTSLINQLRSGLDTIGHGTVVAANLFSVAPKVECIMVKQKNWDLMVNLYQSFDTALSLEPLPDIISCSWFTDEKDERIEILINKAINDMGITVVCSCGNDGQNGNIPTFPGDMPGVISVGGAYPSDEGDWQASSYALSGESENYPGRFAPDVCGVVGQQPHGRLIMSPVGIGGDLYHSIILGDKTSPKDGWAVLSGTSCAAPQVAGAVALMLQINPDLTPIEIKNILNSTATDVTSGKSASEDLATSGQSTSSGVITINVPDVATGYGVVNVNEAIKGLP